MSDPLFDAAWPQAVATSRAAAAQRRRRREALNRSGVNGAFARAMQLDVDGMHAAMRRAVNRQINGVRVDTIVFDEAAE